MDIEANKDDSCHRGYVYSKATCSIIILILLSTILWIFGCEILWYGSTWMEIIYKTKNAYYLCKTIGLICLLSIGVVINIVATSIVLFGIPLTIVHIDHLFNRKQNPNSNEATRWTLSILVLVFVGLVIGTAGCEVIQYSGLNFKALFHEDNQMNQLLFYFRQCLFLATMFCGLLLFSIGFLLAPFTLAFAGVVSFDKRKNSYRSRIRRRRQANRTLNPIIEV